MTTEKKHSNNWLWIVLGLLVVVFIAMKRPPPVKLPPELQRQADLMTQRMMNAKAYDDSLVLNVPWKLGGFDNVVVASVTITNKGSRGIKDVAIACTTTGKSGTELSEVGKTIYDIFPAGKKKTVRDVNMGLVNSQSESMGCHIEKYAFTD